MAKVSSILLFYVKSFQHYDLLCKSNDWFLYEIQNWAEMDELGSISTKLICRYEAWSYKEKKLKTKKKNTQERQLKRKINIPMKENNSDQK